MKKYDITVPVYADTEEQAKKSAVLLTKFVEEVKANGRAVTAEGLANAAIRWQSNAFIKNEILKHFPKIAK